jgi:MraZ protein
MLLTGSFARSIDEKQRVAIPKRLRDALGTPDVEFLFVTPGTDGSVGIYTEEELAKLANRLAVSSPAQQEVRAFGRLFYSQAERVELDSQGRIRIPAELARQAQLGKEAMLLGVLDHMELWDKARWEAYFADKSPQYDKIAEAAFAAPGA